MKINRITVGTVKLIAHQLAVATMSWDEPIPAFETRFPRVLESCLNSPFQTYNYRDLYSGIYKKAAVLFYLIIKNHPFQNGNKRIAVTTLLVFLFLNKFWIKVQPSKLYNLAIWVAESKPENKDLILAGLEDFLKRYSEAIK